MSDELARVHEHATDARAAQRLLASADASRRTAVLRRVASLLQQRQSVLLEANLQDRMDAEASGVAPPLLSRLELSASKLATLRSGLDALATSHDPVGRVLTCTALDDQLVLSRVMSPIGVILVIFESRPDAVVQIGGLAIRSGNAVLLKGGSEATASNRALVDCLRDALRDEGLQADAVQGIEGRDVANQLLSLHGDIDLVIPRGSGQLVRSIQASTRIPVLGHAEGVCMLYIDRHADVQMAAKLAVDGKCDYPAACNATETLLVHEDFLPHLPVVGNALRARGVELRADARARAHLPESEPASPEDGRTEYGALVLAVRTVATVEDAIAYVHANGSGHTDAIVTSDTQAAERFLREVDSASVFHNASTRFADGYRYGLGAEVGISTSRIHARPNLRYAARARPVLRGSSPTPTPGRWTGW
ncbi:MAG: glutamate-5-semialdehyde dehydrogenase [Polyangiaceae bacterium]|nr:glutamate-5-semialdehyde dehydrogenase [Polyangiaceae bacterium]